MKNENWSKLNFRQKVGFWLVRRLALLQLWVQTNVLRTMIWKAADGRCIPIEKLTDAHLNSAIRMLIREGRRENQLAYLVDEQRRRSPLLYADAKEAEET